MSSVIVTVYVTDLLILDAVNVFLIGIRAQVVNKSEVVLT